MTSPALDFNDVIARESTQLIDAVRNAPDVPVPWCDDWTAEDMGRHIGAVWTLAAHNIAAMNPEAMTPLGDAGQPADSQDLCVWMEERRTALLEVLVATPDDSPAWAFATDNPTTGFWRRRMAQETVVHRWDAEAARGLVNPIHPELAADGVAEYLAVGLRFSSSRPNRFYPHETLHLHRTDGPGEWLLTGHGQDGVDIATVHADADAHVTGTAEGLLLWIWGRPTDEIEITGSAAVAAAWQALAP